MNTDEAERQARTNPQAYACAGITFTAGLVGVFFGVFLTDLLLRVTIAVVCSILFVAGICGHGYFEKQEAVPGFRPSRKMRRALGICFGVSVVGALAFAIFSAVSAHLGNTVIPAAWACLEKVDTNSGGFDVV